MLKNISAILLFFIAFSSSAQQLSAPDNKSAKRDPQTQFLAARVDENLKTVGTASIQSPVSVEDAVQITAVSGDSDASIKLSTPKIHDSTGTHYLSVVIKSPLAKKGRTTLLSPDGVPDSTSAELKYTRWKIVGIQAGSNAVGDLCDKVYLPMYVAIGKKAEDFNCDTDSIKELLVAKKITEEDYQAFRRNFFPSPYAGALNWGASAKVGYQDFEYYDSMTLAKNEQRKKNYGASVYFGYVPASSATAYTATFSVQRSYKEADGQVACLPTTTGAILSCVNGALSAPTNTVKRIISLEHRRSVSKTLAIAIQLSHDFASGVNTIDIPVYLISDGKAGLSGGFAVGYSSDKDKIQLGVFVTQPFSLFN